MRPHILSVDEIDEAPRLTRSLIEYFWRKYGAPRDDVRYSLLLHRKGVGSVVQKTYFAICGWNLPRDEATLFARILKEQGLDVMDHIYSELPHGFWATCPDLAVSAE
jgi:acetyl esterase/lipase